MVLDDFEIQCRKIENSYQLIGIFEQPKIQLMKENQCFLKPKFHHKLIFGGWDLRERNKAGSYGEKSSYLILNQNKWFSLEPSDHQNASPRKTWNDFKIEFFSTQKWTFQLRAWWKKSCYQIRCLKMETNQTYWHFWNHGIFQICRQPQKQKILQRKARAKVRFRPCWEISGL